jgi:hypothetical protein
LTFQPESTNSRASQSSSSGWLGDSPWTPKFSLVLTSPWPKNCCQKRLTTTRAVRGWSGLVSHWAEAEAGSRRPGGPGAQECFGDAGFDALAGQIVLAAEENMGGAGFAGQLLHDHHGGHAAGDAQALFAQGFQFGIRRGQPGQAAHFGAAERPGSRTVPL